MSLRPDDRSSKSSRRERSRSRSRYDDDDGDDESPRSSRTKLSRSSRPEDDPNDRSSKPRSSRSRREDDDYHDEPSKPSKSRSRYDEDEDGNGRYSAASSKSKSRSDDRRHDDDDDGDSPRTTKSKSRSARFEDEEDSAAKLSRSHRKSLRFDAEDQESDGKKASATMPSMPGGFNDYDDDDHLAYDTRQTSRRTPGLSSVLGIATVGGGRGGDSDTEPNDRRRERERKGKLESRSSRGSAFDQARPPSSSFFDPGERIEEVRKPSRKSASFQGHTDAASSVPYPDTDHGFMPSMPALIGDEENYGVMLPYGASRPYDWEDDDKHLAYAAKPISRSRTNDYDEDKVARRPKSPTRSVSFPQPSADPREAASRRESQLESALLSVRRPKDSSGLSPNGKPGNTRLSVNTDNHGPGTGGGRPPASPLLEPYHGTYQSVSPMPSPLMAPEASHDDDNDNIDELEGFSLEERKPSAAAATLTRKKSIDPKTGKKRVVLYDSEGDADKLAKALNHHEARPAPLIEVLPELTHDQLLALREQYKKRVKVSGRGVNLCKQIKATTTGNFGKAAYATSLGRWEAEAYWANFWYQAHSSNRELLIEALMGKTNAEMREINGSFKDKRYQDSLALCMEKELKPDKFRAAVLTALEARRQEETDVWPQEYRNRDVEVLHRALRSRDGGESAILDIVVRRSESHLREILKIYDRMHDENFAKAALAKSNNLVGEVIAHILNGVINRPARDCLLLRHAVRDVSSKSREVELRYELLISRLIRLHWDRTHLAKVKEEYKSRYGEDIERSIKKATHGDFMAFCVRLCET